MLGKGTFYTYMHIWVPRYRREAINRQSIPPALGTTTTKW
jgi:hypothetical protein